MTVKRNEFYNSKSYYIVAGIIMFLALVLLMQGCSMFEPYTDSKGVDHTKIGDTLAIVGQTAQSVGGFIPGFGTLIAGIGGVIALIGGGITSVVSSRRKESMLKTIMHGVEEATTTYDQTKDALITGLKGKMSETDYAKMLSIINNTDSVKSIIKKISEIIGNSGMLDKNVQKIVGGV